MEFQKSFFLFKVKSNEVLGRYLIAKRDIKPGEVIIREVPYVVGPKITSYPMCLGCHKTISSAGFYNCSKCTWPMCGRNCENLATHADECRLMSEKKFKCPIRNTLKAESSYCVIVPLRVIQMKITNPKM